MRHRAPVLIVLALTGVVGAADPAPVSPPAAFDWGPRHVHVSDAWPGASAGMDWAKVAPGIIVLRGGTSPDSGPADYWQGWAAEPGKAAGVIVLLATEVPPEARVEVVTFGRTGDTVTLTAVLHATGGVVPDAVKAVVRRKLGQAEGSRAPVGLDDVRAAKIGGKRFFLTAPFPEDLPPGEYDVKVDLKDGAGKVLEHFEARAARREPLDDLKGLSDAQLLAEYVKRGEALRGTPVEPTDFPLPKVAAVFPYESPPSRALQATRHEIVRRGQRMVDGLMARLETEAVRNAGQSNHLDANFGLAIDIMRMLAQIDDPRAVPLLLRVANGLDGKANEPVRDAAVKAIASLTRVAFEVEKTNPPSSTAMPDESAEVVKDRTLIRPAQRTAELAARYATWLDGAGKDPAQWAALARGRALKALAGEDPLARRAALAFLFNRYAHAEVTNTSDEEFRAVSDLVRRTKPAGTDHDFRLASAVAAFGPASRVHADFLIAGAGSPPAWDAFARLGRVGGEKAMAYMVSALPGLRKECDRHGVAVRAPLDGGWSDLAARRAVLAYRACLWSIERWAGRTFAGEAEVAAWWEKAKDKSQRQWLEENLDRTAAEADAGNARAQLLLRQAVPSLPHPEEDDYIDPPWQRRENVPYRETRVGPFRAAWLKANREKLKYDEQPSLFQAAK